MASAKRAERNKVTDIFIAAQRGSYAWPRHWQRIIAKIDVKMDVRENRYTYTVHVANPEWRRTMLEADAATLLGLQQLPERTAGVIDFATVEELDTWAAMADRLDN